MSGLAGGEPHTFTVAAANAVGEGPESEPTDPVVPEVGVTVPGAAAITDATPDNGMVYLSWADPADDGGEALSGFIVRIYRNGTLIRTTGHSPATHFQLYSALDNGVSHTVTVSAWNSAGEGPPAEITVVPRTVPTAPRLTALTAGNGAVLVRWAAPTSNGGAALTGYAVRAYRGASLVATFGVSGAATSVTVTGLANGYAHTFTVTAANVAGAGAVSARSGSVWPRTVPGQTRIGAPSAGRSSAYVRWAAPTSNGGAPITTYVVRAYRGSALAKTVTVKGTVGAVTVTGLAPGASYAFTVTAVNVAGAGRTSAVSARVVPRR
jgi:titin